MNTKEENISDLMGRDILPFLSARIRSALQKAIPASQGGIEEIRLRADKPFMMLGNGREMFLSTDGILTASKANGLIVTQNDIFKTLELISENSIYAYQEEIKNGFITLKGGHRVGISGRVVLEGTSIKNIKDISGLNIRLSRQVKGCSKAVIKYIINNTSVCNTLIISPPQCGKTTMLRDITRLISDGGNETGNRGLKVGVVDERSEIAACYKGVPQNDIGLRTDILDGCPKAAGMIMMLRAMSPQVIVTDEIGNAGDKEAVRQIINAGVKIITTAHGFNISEMKTRQEVVSLMEEKVFERLIVLSNLAGPGTLEEVVEGSTMEFLYKREK